jgi:ribosomal protein S18 acetylase RimI-like enzyme
LGVTCRVTDAAFDRWDELHRLLMESFAYMAPRIDPPSSLLRMGVADLAAKTVQETLLLAADGDRLVGCVFLRLEPDRAYVGKLAVDAAYRGQGIARRLLAMAEVFAVDHGRVALELQTRVELTENHAAFSRLGFVKVAETAHPGYDRPTSITMRKPIAASPDAATAIRQMESQAS